MPTPPIPDSLCIEALNAEATYGSAHEASKALGIPSGTLYSRIRIARKRGLSPTVEVLDEKKQIANLERENNELKRQLKRSENQESLEHQVKTKILNLVETVPDPPDWTLESQKKSFSGPGVPTGLWSDWHCGEVIFPEQIKPIENKYNLTIFQNRVKRLTEGTIDLLTNHMVNPNYPGIVICLGGDMVSGDIHDLSETNEAPIMKAVLKLFDTLIWSITQLHNVFGRVHIVGVVGNHGRTTFKPKTKHRCYTNFDWLVYHMLASHFKYEKDITFQIPDSADTMFRVYEHIYALTHGDQFSGGGGITGAVFPIALGDIKKRARNTQIGYYYDTLLMGHFHQLMITRRFVVNGSLSGYGEYPYLKNMSVEPPMQALWLTHPQWGMTFKVPVYVDPKTKQKTGNWVSLEASQN